MIQKIVVDQFIAFCEDYLSKVSLAVDLLNAKSEKEPGFQARSRLGFLDADKAISYDFHGIGCCVGFKHEDYFVDFDFGDDARCDIIKPWFLYWFFKHFDGEYLNLTDEKQFIQICDYLVTQDIMVALKERKGYYQFKKDWLNPNRHCFNV